MPTLALLGGIPIRTRPFTAWPVFGKAEEDRLVQVLRSVVRALTALSENIYLSAIRAGMVALVPLTIIGGLFLIVAYLPVTGGRRVSLRMCRSCRSR